MLNLDQTLCDGCRKPLPLIRHDDMHADATPGHGVQVWPDGVWISACKCGWEVVDAKGSVPTWRTVAPALCAEVERLACERDEARAALARINSTRPAASSQSTTGI